jgi:hypothetical protein
MRSETLLTAPTDLNVLMFYHNRSAQRSRLSCNANFVQRRARFTRGFGPSRSTAAVPSAGQRHKEDAQIHWSLRLVGSLQLVDRMSPVATSTADNRSGKKSCQEYDAGTWTNPLFDHETGGTSRINGSDFSMSTRTAGGPSPYKLVSLSKLITKLAAKVRLPCQTEKVKGIYYLLLCASSACCAFSASMSALGIA